MEEKIFHDILISGGLGFIGSNLALQLANSSFSAILIDSLNPSYGGNLRNIEQSSNKSQLQINISDVRDQHSLRYLLQNTSLIYNLAGQTSHMDSMADPFTDLDINARPSCRSWKYVAS